MHSRWLSIYIYHPEPFEGLLVDVIRPLVRRAYKQGLSTRFFFVRYWEGGPHIRLRLLARNEQIIPALKECVLGGLGGCICSNPSLRDIADGNRHSINRHEWDPTDSLQFVEYIPEFDRYGGIDVIDLSEELFDASSRTILEILSSSKQWTYDHAMGAALQMHMALFCALDLTPFQVNAVCGLDTALRDRDRIHELSPYPRLPSRTLPLADFESVFTDRARELQSSFSIIRGAVTDRRTFTAQWMNKWICASRRFGMVYRRTKEKKQKVANLTVTPVSRERVAATKFERVISSHVHMSNNRMGVRKVDEALLYYLLSRTFEVVR